MIIHKIWIKNFRNISETLIENKPLSSNFVLLGENNQGKTNFLYALYYAGNKSLPINIATQELFFQQTSRAVLALLFQKTCESEIEKLVIELSPNDIKYTLGEQVYKQKNVISKLFPVVYFSADTIFSFIQDPQSRRSTLDQWIEKLDKNYKAVLTRYTKLIKQKNKALKEENSDVVNVLSKQLASFAPEIIRTRLTWIKELEQELKRILRVFFDDSELDLKLSYFAKYLNPNLSLNDDIEGYLKKAVMEQSSKEKCLKYTIVGPHQDDLVIRINKKEFLKSFSRGIQRSVVLFYHFAQLNILKKTSCLPLVLLDDAFVELDNTKKENIVNYVCKHYNTIYATTQKQEALLFNSQIISVKNGEFKMIDT